MGVWIRPKSDKLLLPASVVFTDRRRAGLPFRNSSNLLSLSIPAYILDTQKRDLESCLAHVFCQVAEGRYHIRVHSLIV
jgi:hypothetical protein